MNLVFLAPEAVYMVAVSGGPKYIPRPRKPQSVRVPPRHITMSGGTSPRVRIPTTFLQFYPKMIK
jgi:hypothetical protein